jgi:hypothetical protein
MLRESAPNENSERRTRAWIFHQEVRCFSVRSHLVKQIDSAQLTWPSYPQTVEVADLGISVEGQRSSAFTSNSIHLIVFIGVPENWHL